MKGGNRTRSWRDGRSASCECGFDIELWLPALDSFVADLFATGLDGFDSEAIDHLEYVRSDALG